MLRSVVPLYSPGQPCDLLLLIFNYCKNLISPQQRIGQMNLSFPMVTVLVWYSLELVLLSGEILIHSLHSVDKPSGFSCSSNSLSIFRPLGELVVSLALRVIGIIHYSVLQVAESAAIRWKTCSSSFKSGLCYGRWHKYVERICLNQ